MTTGKRRAWLTPRGNRPAGLVRLQPGDVRTPRRAQIATLDVDQRNQTFGITRTVMWHLLLLLRADDEMRRWLSCWNPGANGPHHR
jgi:hypothetical protein